MATIDTLDIQITSDSSVLVRELNAITNALNGINKTNKNLTKLKANIQGVNNASKGLSNLSKITKAINFGGMLIGLNKLTDGIAKSVNSINDYVEDINLFKQTMGEFSQEAGDYAHELQDLMGIDASQFMRNQAVFMSMANGFGLAREQAYEMSKGLTELAYDFSSLYNVDLEEMFIKLQSAIAGEIEPIRRLGVSLTEATLKELALEKGITKSVEAMTEAEKAQLRYIAIVETATSNHVINDFARTLESPANAMRILKQQVTQLGRAIGSVFIPIISQVIPYVLAFAKVLTSAIKSLATLVRFKMPDWTNKDWSSGVSGVSDVAEDTADKLGGASKKAKELKKSLMGFDELNVLPSPTEPSSGGASGGISGGGDLGLDIKSVWDETTFGLIDKQTSDLINNFKELGNSIKSAFTDNFGTIKAVVSLIVGVGAGILAWKFIPTILSAFSGGIGTIKGVLETLAIHFSYFVDGVVNFFTIASTSFLPLVAIIMAVASVVYVLWTNFDLVVAVIKGFIEKIGIAEKFEAIKQALKPLIEAVANLDDFFTILGSTILLILQPAIAIIMGVFNAFIGIIKPLITIVTGIINIFGALGNFLVGIFKGDLNIISEAISLMCVAIAQVFSGMVETIKNLVEGFVMGIINWFWNLWDVLVGHSIVPDLANEIMNIFSGMIGSVTKWIGDFVGGIINWFANLYNGITDKVKAIKDSVVSKVKEIWNGIVSWFDSNVAPKFTAKYWVDKFSGLKDGFSQTIKNMLNTGIDKINEFIRWLNGKLKFSWGGLTIAGKKIYDGGSVQLVRLTEITQRFEDGGFIEDGLFTMNKGEIAGQFDNGKSVVANNYQITEGIAQAVKQAIRETNGFGSKDITFNATFEMDSEVVGKKVIKYHNGIVNQTGESPLTI